MTPALANSILLLDSSIVVKWFRAEPGCERARALRDGFVAGQWEICLSDLVLYETANALHYSGDFTLAEITEYIESVIALEIPIELFDLFVLERALASSRQYGIAIYDSYLVALAQHKQMIFVTDDNRLLRKLNGITNIVRLQDLAIPSK
jgi:predicted nucleic acid-binding protein